MYPGFDSLTRRHMWAEFVVGSRPCSEGFSPGSSVFLPCQKSTFLNFDSIGNWRATGLSVEDCFVLCSLNQVNFFILFIYCLGDLLARVGDQEIWSVSGRLLLNLGVLAHM